MISQFCSVISRHSVSAVPADSLVKGETQTIFIRSEGTKSKWAKSQEEEERYTLSPPGSSCIQMGSESPPLFTVEGKATAPIHYNRGYENTQRRGAPLSRQREIE